MTNPTQKTHGKTTKNTLNEGKKKQRLLRGMSGTATSSPIEMKDVPADKLCIMHLHCCFFCEAPSTFQKLLQYERLPVFH